jgi:predicted SnoaL-like aldol condensation-catalyzing enzyme
VRCCIADFFTKLLLEKTAKRVVREGSLAKHLKFVQAKTGSVNQVSTDSWRFHGNKYCQ